MERLKRSFRNSFRRKKSSASHQTESSKPHQWEGDEIAVRNGNCSFPVKYLGCVQVQDSRGMHICEQALLTLKAQKKGKSIKGQLYVSGDGLRVVDDETKGLIVDQTIEKVSFCAPDRNHDRGFSYICRDGTTRRWMCHGFLASKDTGDRLSHAVGCSFAVCLERKQKRDAKLAEIKQVNAVTNNSSLNSIGTLGSSMNNSSLNSTEVNNENSRQNFSRTGSFRRIPMRQRMTDPQECKLIEPVPVKEVHNPYAIKRPHATPQLLERQGSCRIFKDLNQNSPFKRQLSLRFTPSQMERQQRKTSLQTQDSMFNKYTDTSINNFTLNSTNQQSNNLNNKFNEKFNENFNDQNRIENNELKDMCKTINENLSILSNKQDLFDDNFQFNKTNTSIKKPNSSANSTILNSKTPTPDYINDSIHKTVINVHNNSKSSSSPIKDEKSINKFGQLSSYLDESFFNDTTTTTSIKQMKSNGVMFTDLDEPFEANFDQLHNNNITKINIDEQFNNRNNSLNNSSINSLSNSLTSNDTSIKEITNKSTKMMNKINLINNDYLVNELNNKMNLNNTDNLTNNNNIMNKKLNDKDIFDPFDSNWVQDDLNRNTNPFLQNMNTTVNTYKTFELKM